MNAKRTDPRVHCWQRQRQGDYVSAAGTTPDHLRAVYDAERQRLAEAEKPRRKRRAPAAGAAPAIDARQRQLQLVA